MFVNGELRNVLIDKNEPDFSLEGMINPSFQNDGEAIVYIDGRKVAPNETYVVNAPNVILKNKIPITFEMVSNKKRVLYLGFVKTV